MQDDKIFRVTLRIDRDIANFLDRYHYGTRSDVVRNIIYQRMRSDDPILAISDIYSKLSTADDKELEMLLRKFTNIRKEFKEQLQQYNEACRMISSMEEYGHIDRAICKLNMLREQKMLEKFC